MHKDSSSSFTVIQDREKAVSSYVPRTLWWTARFWLLWAWRPFFLSSMNLVLYCLHLHSAPHFTWPFCAWAALFKDLESINRSLNTQTRNSKCKRTKTWPNFQNHCPIGWMTSIMTSLASKDVDASGLHCLCQASWLCGLWRRPELFRPEQTR